ncbi:hypothetical protein ACP3A4_002573 [Serratia marcescens]|uniref:hypothetical protein n=1 Tax=Serratia marcescens TaxID=615 RepID=UPI0039908943
MAFRDFLRKHHGIAEQHKHQAAEDRRQNPAAYGRLKNELIQRHEQLALAWLATGETP